MNLPSPQAADNGMAANLMWANKRVAFDEDGETELREALPTQVKAAKKRKLRRRVPPVAVDRGYVAARDLSYNPHTARAKAFLYALQAFGTVLPVLPLLGFPCPVLRGLVIGVYATAAMQRR